MKDSCIFIILLDKEISSIFQQLIYPWLPPYPQISFLTNLKSFWRYDFKGCLIHRFLENSLTDFDGFFFHRQRVLPDLSHLSRVGWFQIIGSVVQIFFQSMHSVEHQSQAKKQHKDECQGETSRGPKRPPGVTDLAGSGQRGGERPTRISHMVDNTVNVPLYHWKVKASFC